MATVAEMADWMNVYLFDRMQAGEGEEASKTVRDRTREQFPAATATEIEQALEIASALVQAENARRKGQIS